MTDPRTTCRVPNDPTIALLVQERRRSRITQEQIAKVIGVSASNFSLWENEKQQPLFGNVVAWANSLGLDLKLVRRV